jgi:serine protease Do
MSSRKSTVFYGVLLALASLVVGMVIASRLDLSPASFARSFDVPSSNSAPISGPLDATTFRTIAQVAGPSVVSIRTASRQQTRSIDELFGLQPFGGRRGQPPQQDLVRSGGSGFIIDKQGFILTNNHVIEDAVDIEVKLSDMEDLPGVPWLAAKLVGRDPLTDSALIQLTDLPEAPLQPLKFGDSSQLAAGDWVMAVGNPYQLSNTVTVGVVSAVGRPYMASPGRWEDMIQTDAAINRGNSGGPLLNLRGEVIGVNTMILSDGNGLGGNLGIGFAVPINTVRDILDQLHTGKVVRGRIGVNVDRASLTRNDISDLGLPSTGGALVSDLGEGPGPAKEAGIRVGDVIVEFNGKVVHNSSELVSLVTRTKPGTTVPVKVIRNKKPMTLNVTVAELDLDAETRSAAAGPGEGPVVRPTETGFGMTIERITPAIARQLNLPNGRGGAVVSDIEPFSPAQQGGIGRGDVILAVNDRAVTTVDQVDEALDQVAAGRTARILVWRGGREVLVRLIKR